MKKRKSRWLIYGLLLGILLGLAIVAVQNLIAQQLVKLLEEEATKACDCQFKTDRVDVSLLTMSAEAKNARIESQGKVGLQFARMTLGFSMDRLATHEIALNDLHLYDGWADNVDDDSITFKFIDSLTEPVAPERDYPGRWKVWLRNLIITNTGFVQEYSTSRILGSAGELSMIRNEDDDFVLYPKIGQLELVLKPNTYRTEEKRIYLGGVTSTITLRDIDDAHAIFKDLTLKNDPNLIALNAISKNREHNKLSGSGLFNLNTRLLQIADYLPGQLAGQFNLGGVLGNPQLNGSFTQAADQPELPLLLSNYSLFVLNSLKSDFSLDLNHGKPQLYLRNFLGQGAGVEVTQAQDLHLDDSFLKAGFLIKMDKLVYDIFEIENVNAEAQLQGELGDLKVAVTGSSAGLKLPAYYVPGVNFQLNMDKEIDFSVTHQSLENGKLELAGKLQDRTEGLFASKIDLQMLDFSAFELQSEGSTIEQDEPKRLRISGRGTLAGPVSLTGLNGQIGLNVSSNYFGSTSDLQGEASLAGGQLKLKTFNSDGSININADLDLPGNNLSEVNLALKNFRPSTYDPATTCFAVDAQARYKFNLREYLKGNGNILLSRIQLGCNLYAVSMKNATNLLIQNGRINLKAVAFSGEDSSFTLSGYASPGKIDVLIDGNLLLATFVGLLPNVDDLKGSARSSLKIAGSPGHYKIDGKMDVKDGELVVESADILAQRINGTLLFDGELVKIGGLSGMLNEGSFSVEGTLNPYDLNKSQITAKMQGIGLNPSADVSLVASSTLRMQQIDSSQPVLEGEIVIESGELKKNIDFRAMLLELAQASFSSSEQPLLNFSNLPNLKLNLSVKATNNVFLLSDLLTAEFEGGLQVSGSLNNPIIAGQLKTLTGWIGLKNRRFEISSGIIRFTPPAFLPEIEIIGETSVFTRSGDFTTIILEARGSLENPEIRLLSDLGLTQQEILNVLTTEFVERDSTMVNTLGQDPFDSSLALLDDDPDDLLTHTLYKLTSIDSVSVEPAFNNQTGIIEPSVNARKNITGRLALIGDSFLSSGNYSRAKLRYDLTPFLALIGSIETSNVEDNNPLGVDLTYTVFAKQSIFLDISITGNDYFDKYTLLDKLRINANSRLTSADLERVIRQITGIYKDSGYFKTVVTASCPEEKIYCKKLDLVIEEGPRARLLAVQYTGEALPKRMGDKHWPTVTPDYPATRAQLERVRRVTTRALRSEGYIASRVSTSYAAGEGIDKYYLVVEVFTGKQESFVFQGNTVFQAEDFLNSINLFRRKQPFGKNTIRILVENMEEMYRRAGYLYASINFNSEFNATEGKLIHTLVIKEENPVTVEEVVFQTKLPETNDLLKEQLASKYPNLVTPILLPSKAIEEDLSNYKALLLVLLKSSGFPKARVSYVIEPAEQPDTVKIIYKINEGEALRASELALVGLPEGLVAPAFPEAPVAIPTANTYVEKLRSYLSSVGYREAVVYAQLGAADNLEITLEPGQLTRIGNITIEGLENVPEETIRERLEFNSGDPWSEENITETRRKLLVLGIFSRVDIRAVDGSLDQYTEDLLVEVIERPLTSLEVGGGVSSELGVHAFGEAIDKSLFQDGRRLSMRMDAYIDETNNSINQGVIGANYMQPTFITDDYRLTVDGRYQKLSLSTLPYDLDRYILDSAVFNGDQSGLSYTLGYALSQDNMEDVAPDAILSYLDEGTVNLGMLRASLTVDHRDSPVNPMSGYYAYLDSKFTARGMGSDANLYSLGGRFAFLQRIPSTSFIFANNTRSASTWTFGGTPEVPISQRYNLGGRTTVRGYRENSLGPKGDQGSTLGGDLLVQNNTELRYLMTETFSTHIFLDAGSVFLTEQASDLSDLRYGTGVGLRYYSPIGPIGFDIGHALDEKEGEPSVRFHFSIGAIF